MIVILLDDSDSDPPWRNKYVENKNRWKQQKYMNYRKMVVNDQEVTCLVSEVISRRKDEYQNHLAL